MTKLKKVGVAASPLDLADLADGECIGLTAHRGGALAEAGAVCLESQKHTQGVALKVTGEATHTFTVQWPAVTTQMKRTYADDEEATEEGACAVAICIVRTVTRLPVSSRSRKGTGFDYWVGSNDEDFPFQDLSRLEVSGLRQGTEKDARKRLEQKVEQTKQSDRLKTTYGTSLSAYVVVVEFSRPMALVRMRL